MKNKNEYLPEGSRAAKAKYTIEELQQAQATGQILESVAVSCDTDRNLHFDLGCMHGIMMRDDCVAGIKEGETREGGILFRVGHPTCFVVLEIIEDGENTHAVLSREAAQKKCISNYLDKLSIGDILPCKVINMEKYGVFCDVGCGVVALLPVANLSVSRVTSPVERVQKGDELVCVLKNRDEKGRMILTLKELLGTWEENAAHFSAGETVIGVVRGVEDYGVFVELKPNLSALAEKEHNLGDLKPGQAVSVFIKAISPEKMKIKLALLSRLNEPVATGAVKYAQTDGHMTRWIYSPAQAERLVETVF